MPKEKPSGKYNLTEKMWFIFNQYLKKLNGILTILQVFQYTVLKSRVEKNLELAIFDLFFDVYKIILYIKSYI